MKKTYITTMPNHIGAFLKASECFAALGVNITRVSYNITMRMFSPTYLPKGLSAGESHR